MSLCLDNVFGLGFENLMQKEFWEEVTVLLVLTQSTARLKWGNDLGHGNFRLTNA